MVGKGIQPKRTPPEGTKHNYTQNSLKFVSLCQAANIFTRNTVLGTGKVPISVRGGLSAFVMQSLDSLYTNSIGQLEKTSK